MDYSVIYSDYDSFLSYLKRNYKKALENLRYFDYSELYLNEMSEDVSESIKELLTRNNFILNSRNIKTLDYNPLFLICSLENNFTGTIKCLVKEKADVKYIPTFDNENRMLRELLINRGFVLMPKNLDVIRSSSEFLLASLENDFEKTIKLLNKSDVNATYMSNRQAEELISLVFHEKKMSFKKLPVALKNNILTYIYNNEGSTYFSYLVENKLVPMTYFPSDIVGFSDELLEKGCSNEKEYEFLKFKIGDYSSKRYEKVDEEEFLKILSRKYKGCNCVEDVIRQMHNKKMKREDMSLMEVFAFNLYASKVLQRNGITADVEVLGFDYNMDKYGVQTERGITLFINGAVNTVEEMIGTLNHEIEHVIQKENIKNCRIDVDHDIDLYSKDFILATVVDDYYKSNMTSISFEYDAEFKSNLRTALVLGLTSELDFKNMSIEELLYNKRELICYAKDKVFDTEYTYDMYRIRGIHSQSIDDFFQRVMVWLQRGDKNKFLEVLEDYPIIKYDYKCDSVFRRKSIEELVEDLENSDNHDKGIYFNLLISRLDEDKNEEYEENLEDLEAILKNNTYSKKTNLIIENVVRRANNTAHAKYNGYINSVNNHRI